MHACTVRPYLVFFSDWQSVLRVLGVGAGPVDRSGTDFVSAEKSLGCRAVAERHRHDGRLQSRCCRRPWSRSLRPGGRRGAVRCGGMRWGTVRWGGEGISLSLSLGDIDRGGVYVYVVSFQYRVHTGFSLAAMRIFFCTPTVVVSKPN